MNRILKKDALSKSVKRIIVDAPLVAKKALPGQFVVIRVWEKGERIPLTISSKDHQNGTITLVFQEVGKTTAHLGTLRVGDSILDLVGPLGRPTRVERVGEVVSVGGGVGAAVLYPVTRAFREVGNKISVILGARSHDLLILEEELQRVSDEFFVTTDDGSKGEHGLVTDVLRRLIQKGRRIDLVIAIGPLPMMRAVSELTKKHKIKTLVSLNPIMIDATGMCGACRVTVDGRTYFTCVDGPEFDGHGVDWEELWARQRLFLDEERRSYDRFLKEGTGCGCQRK